MKFIHLSSYEWSFYLVIYCEWFISNYLFTFKSEYSTSFQHSNGIFLAATCSFYFN